MKKYSVLLLAALVVAVAAGNANAALSVSLYDAINSPITTFSVNITGNTIDIYETWTGTTITPWYGYVMISGFEDEVDYTVRKHLTNNTGVDWTTFTNELLDPLGQDEDDLDPYGGLGPLPEQVPELPYPSWVPAGYSTSNDDDGLSFAQGSGLPRTSTTFPSLYVDELFHVRDFLEFSGGTVSGAGGTDLMTFGLRDNNVTSLAAPNQPFLLVQRVNDPIPEPATLILLGAGLAGAGLIRRRKKA